LLLMGGMFLPSIASYSYPKCTARRATVICLWQPLVDGLKSFTNFHNPVGSPDEEHCWFHCLSLPVESYSLFIWNVTSFLFKIEMVLITKPSLYIVEIEIGTK
jgi:hypothetical protein